MNHAGAVESFYQRCRKRIADFTLALIGLVLFGIPMLAVGLLIRLVDGAPILFQQQRVGMHGRLFTICKYRTMRNRAQQEWLPRPRFFPRYRAYMASADTARFLQI